MAGGLPSGKNICLIISYRKKYELAHNGRDALDQTNQRTFEKLCNENHLSLLGKLWAMDNKRPLCVVQNIECWNPRHIWWQSRFLKHFKYLHHCIAVIWIAWCRIHRYVPLGRFRKFKSCQNHLQLHLWLPNYVVLTVRTEKSPKKNSTSYARGVPKKVILQCKNKRKSSKSKNGVIIQCFVLPDGCQGAWKGLSLIPAAWLKAAVTIRRIPKNRLIFLLILLGISFIQRNVETKR